MAFNGSGCSRSTSGTAECGLKKTPWTPEEDDILKEYVKVHGEGNWGSIQEITGLNKSGKSCRNRWANYLRPNLKKGAFSAEEENLILELHGKHGNKWAYIASQLHGRTDNEVKNYWNMRRKKCQREGLAIHRREMHQVNQPPSSSPSQTFLSHFASFQPQAPKHLCFSGSRVSLSPNDSIAPNMLDKSCSANHLLVARDSNAGPIEVVLGLPSMQSPWMVTSTREPFSSDNVIATPSNGAGDFEAMKSEIMIGPENQNSQDGFRFIDEELMKLLDFSLSAPLPEWDDLDPRPF
ncbi:transcription factor MYB34-like [Henckelia pumila]|uniref:transcription factor MYB34-like n=1 Tax=Henckelia pumila TaxID=405737 RepID=UPI003C6E9CC8